MMKEWAIARQRIHDIKQSDPQRSDKLNDEITAVSIIFPASSHHLPIIFTSSSSF